MRLNGLLTHQYTFYLLVMLRSNLELIPIKGIQEGRLIRPARAQGPQASGAPKQPMRYFFIS